MQCWEITVKWLHPTFLAIFFFRQWKFILPDSCTESNIRIGNVNVIQMTCFSHLAIIANLANATI